MLEKIGLPPKPSARGRSWVVDASHCQQCASPFSIFNRKHHCRRCGGLFCGNCAQSRMVLRGQGDAPVRICEPCKKLEEAARFEARHGRRRKDENTIESDESLLKSLLNDQDVENASSSSSKDVSVTPETLRQQAQEERVKYVSLKRDGKPEAASKAFKRAKELERQADALASALRKSSRIKTSKSLETSANDEEATKGEMPESKKVITEKKYRGSMAVDDKQDLMRELKELGWSDADLDKKQASDADILGGNEQPNASGPSAAVGALQMEILGHKRKALALKREGNLTEAKEELKKAKQLERRLEELQTLGEEEEEEEEEEVDEVTAILRALEREVDGKNPLSTKQQPVPLSADSLPIFREEDDAHVDVSDTDMSDPDMVAALKAMGWTEEAGALESLNAPVKPQPGGGVKKEEIQAEIVSHKRKALALKRAGNLGEARKELNQAKSLEKMLESSAENEDVEQVDVTEQDMKDPEFLGALQALGFGGEEPAALVADLKVKPRDKLAVQQELLAVKRSALALKRQGKDAESRQQFEQAKILEQQLQAFNQQTAVKQTSVRIDSYRSSHVESDDEDEDDGDVTKHIKDITSDPELAAVLKGLSLDEKTEETLVGPSDAPVPAPSKAVKSRVPKAIGELPQRSKLEIQKELLGKKRKALALRREGKEEEAEKELKEASILDMQLKELEAAERLPPPPFQSLNPVESEEDEDDGNILHSEVTEEDMNDPSMLATLTDMGFKDDGQAEQPKDDDGFEGEIGLTVDIVPPFFSRKETQQNDRPHLKAAAVKQQDGSSIAAAVVQQQDGHLKAAAQKREERRTSESKRTQVTETEAFATVARTERPEEKVALPNSSLEAPPTSIEQQVMEHKRRALNLKRSGDIAGAREELRQAKLLEKQGQQKQAQAGEESLQRQSQQELGSTKRPPAEQQPSRSKDRMKLQQESLAHKRKALGLRREGKIAEAEAEFEIAKSLETQMEELDPQQQHRHAAAVGEEGVEDVLDPQLVAALAGIGWKETDIFSTRATTAVPSMQITLH